MQMNQIPQLEVDKMSKDLKKNEFDSTEWRGPVRKYDIIREGLIATLIVGILVIAFSLTFGSPDDKSLTFKGWATSAPDNFYATAVQELAGTSGTATYGPPYNKGGDGLNVGPLWLQKWAGVTHPIDSVNDFVVTPLTTSVEPVEVTSALAIWKAADEKSKSEWAKNYDDAITKAKGEIGKVPAGNYGPVPALAKGLTDMAKTGGLDNALLSQGGFFQTDNTKQILFFGDGSYLDDAGTAANLQGGTWGMMNETGRYPGQAWLWLYSFWYQIPPFNNEDSHPIGANADAYILFLMGALSLGLILMPKIPLLNQLPYRIPIHRAIWRSYYQAQGISRKRRK
jgi:hypothetical protein